MKDKSSLVKKVFFGGLILGAIGALCYILFR